MRLVTPEDAPLAIFGSAVSTARGRADWSRPASRPSPLPTPRSPIAGDVVVNPGDRHLNVDPVVALPELYGPSIRGIPLGDHGFFVSTRSVECPTRARYSRPVTPRLRGQARGVASQQADTAAESIAALAGQTSAPAVPPCGSRDASDRRKPRTSQRGSPVARDSALRSQTSPTGRRLAGSLPRATGTLPGEARAPERRGTPMSGAAPSQSTACLVLGYDQRTAPGPPRHGRRGSSASSQLVIVHACRPLHAQPSPLSTPSEARGPTGADRRAAAGGRRRLSAIDVEAQVSDRDPVSALVEAARDYGAGGIVVGPSSIPHCTGRLAPSPLS